MTLDADQILKSMNLARRETTASSVGSTVAIFAVGALVGGAIAMLLAPKTGTDLRKGLMEKAGFGGDSETGSKPSGNESGNTRSHGAGSAGTKTGDGMTRPMA